MRLGAAWQKIASSDMGRIPENRVQMVRLLHMTSFIKAEILSIYFDCGSYFLDVFPVAVRFVD
jgi:hypothetical protein